MGILTILKDLEILFAHLMLFTHLLPPLLCAFITLSHEQRASRHAVIENKDDEHQMSPADSFRCLRAFLDGYLDLV